ncbi:type III pantothenate kinase [uncultured Maribacter sp.]|uniref:type III pantothenate kinase n=1 Tax=uncultured Maribacter sp. TaxID=431308 RepID=UPI0026311EC7|nr:type III pantothenate kinase [uncultured Maribacter sp.]
MNLIIDVGNTNVKLAVFKEDSLLFLDIIQGEDLEKKAKNIFKEFPEIKDSILSSVGNLSNKDLEFLKRQTKVHVLNADSKVAFVNKYATPKTLGVDRIALAMAAVTLFPKKNALIIDAGSCVTYDFVDSNGDYLGGAISPGVQMRYKALYSLTSKLPLLEKEDILSFIGNSTETSIHSGVVNGISLEIDGVINQYKTRFKDLTVILTGGDTHFLSKRLKNTIFADSKFLLKGLNHLLEYNKH